MSPSSAAGKGKPRPLLAGVFRKACDYCVRSKRGCNGGTPCEQCIRRGQGCTYSQRRKSGPRGRPLRQQQVISAGGAGGGGGGTPPLVGTRTSSRRRTKRRPSFHDEDDDEEEQEQERRASVEPAAAAVAAAATPVSPGSSPARTVSLSSSASSSDEDEAVTDNDSDSAEQDGEVQPQQQQQQQPSQEVRQRQVHKRSKISRPEAAAGGEGGGVDDTPSPLLLTRKEHDVQNVARVPPCSLLANETRARGDGIRLEEGKPEGAGEEPVPALSPSLSSLSSLSSTSSYGSASSLSVYEGESSYDSKNEIGTAVAVDSPNSNEKEGSPRRQHSPMTVGAPLSPPLLQLERSSSLPTWARDASHDTEQQHEEQQQASIASVGAVPISDGSSNSRIHEVILQPSEIPSSPSPELPPPSPFALPRSVTLVHTSQQQQQLHQQAQAHQAPAFAVKSSSSSSKSSTSRSSSEVFTLKDSALQSLPQAGDPMDVALPQQQQQQHATTLAAASMMLDDGGGFGGSGGLKEWQEDDDLECCPWQIPSLTREMSLARVVAGLGGEQSTLLSQGVGFEGSFVTAAGW
ncbi:unnamed protein product [Scytosiphon promiscuus]